jgi:prepilin-type N-terminal cleavage/methylation domain-containing protein
MAPSRRGFTLVETLIALVLSSFVIILVSHVFLVQNRFFSTQILRTGVQDNVRAATELMAREIRTTLEDGVVVAGPRTLTLRSPIVIGVICHRLGAPLADIMTEGGQAAIDTLEVAGVALRNDSTWEYGNDTWSSLNGSDLSSAAACADNGADTTGAPGQFHRLRRLNLLFSPPPSEGDVLMLFRETTFKIQQSELDPTTFGLFRGRYGSTLVEFATGMDTTAQFQYRTGGSGYADTITAGSLGTIDAVRIVADARKAAPTGGVDDITFGWSVNVSIRNVR